MIKLDETIINHRYLKFLVVDYFHDGKILSIKKDVVTAPICNRAAVSNYFHYVPEIEIKEKREDILIEILGYNYWDKDEKLRDTKRDLYIIRFKDFKYISVTDN